MSNETVGQQSLQAGVRISSELLVPGGSHLIKGDFRQAGLHAGLSLLARALFGLPGTLLVTTNSIAKAVTGRHLHEHVLGLVGAQTQSSQKTPPRKRARLGTPNAAGGAALTPREGSPPAKKSRTRTAAKRGKASGSRVKV